MRSRRRRSRRRHAHDLLGVPILRADTHGDLMSVREAVDTTSKAFATGGEDSAYYLSDSRAMQGFTAPAHRGHAPTDQGLQAEHHRQVANRHPEEHVRVPQVYRLGTRRRE